MLKIWPLPLTVVCVRACMRMCVCVVVVGGEDVITIQTSTMTPLSATVSRVDRLRCWRMGQWLQMHFTLTTSVGICLR